MWLGAFLQGKQLVSDFAAEMDNFKALRRSFALAHEANGCFP